MALSERLLTAATTTEFICWILFAVSRLESARPRISSATTAKPFPASPALAASMLAFNASRLVWLDIFKISSVKLVTCPTLWLSSIAFPSPSNIIPMVSLVLSILFLASLSILSALAFISFENSLISPDLCAIISTSPRTFSVLLLITLTECPTSCMVADSSSVIADKSVALSFDVATLSPTSRTTFSIWFVFSIIIFSICWSLSINRLIPFPRSAISSFDKTATLLVRSPSPLSIPLIMSLMSLFVARIGLITKRITQYNATIRSVTLIAIIMPLLTNAPR